MLSGKQGILPIQDLRDAITEGAIASPGDPIPQANLQPASLDLRLGGIAHRLRCSFLPQGRSVSDRLEEIAMDSMYLDQEGTVLEVNRPYLIPLTETLNLPPDIRARGQPPQFHRPAGHLHPGSSPMTATALTTSPLDTRDPCTWK